MSLECNEPMMAETSGDVMIISESNKKEKNMTQLGNMVCSEKPQINEKSSLPEVKEPRASESCQHDANDSIPVGDEETTEQWDVVTREPNEAQIEYIKEPNKGRNAEESTESCDVVTREPK